MIGNRVLHGVVMASAVAVAAALLLLGAGDRALAAKELVTIPGTNWPLAGTAKMTGGGIETREGGVDGLVRFGRSDDLLEDEFDLLIGPISPGILVRGTYTEPKPGKLLFVVDPTGLETQLEALLADELGTPVEMTITKTTMKVKPKSKNGIETIQVSFNAKASACFNEGEGLVCKNFKLQYKAASSGEPAHLDAGLFKVCEMNINPVGPDWEGTSTMFACDFDGVETVAIDRDLDGNYTDGSEIYKILPGGMISVGASEGVFSDDGQLIGVTEAESLDYMDIAVAMREGSGMTTDDFAGPYFATMFAVNRSTGWAQTYVMLASQTDVGLGLFRVMVSSDPAAIGVASPFTFTVEDDGTFTLVDSHQRGALSSNGSMFMTAEVEEANDIDSITFGFKVGSGLSTRSLHGEYIGNLVGQNTATKALWTARILATFDGVGLARYEFLAHPTAGGLTGYLVYGVNYAGFLALAVLPAGPGEFGIVSADGGAFTVVDTDPSDGQIYVLIGIKMPE